jgi:branched-chain amino acid aminotransferase
MLAFQFTSHVLEPLHTAATSPDELSRQLPSGLYTTFSTHNNGTRVLGLTAHLDRLFAPAQAEGIRPSASRADLRLALVKLAADNAPGESRFRLILSASDGMVYIIVQSFTPLAKEIFERGVKVITADLIRHDPRRKDSSFIAESQSARTKVGGDIFEVLLTRHGKIYEGMTSNFYAVVPIANLHTIVTARTGILLGVTRRAVLRLARGQGMGIQYRLPRLDEKFSEAFLTSSSRGIVPIVQVDDSRVGEGTVGVWTKRLIDAYQAYVQERSEPINVI